MGGTTKEILFSARDNGVESTMSRIKRSAKELSSDLMREASASSNSQKDILKNYEDQIRLIERRNKIDAESSKVDAKDRLDRKMTSPSATSSSRAKAQEQYKSSGSSIDKESRLNEMTISILREMASTMKLKNRSISEKGLRDADGNFIPGTAKTSSGSSNGSGGGVEGSPSKSKSREMSKMDVAGYIMGAQQMFSAQSRAGMVTGVGNTMMGMGGAVGQAGKLASIVGMVGEVMNAVRDSRANLHKNMFQVSAMSGMSAHKLDTDNVGDSAYRQGFSRDEYLSSILPQVAQARGTTAGMEKYASGAMMSMRGTGLDQGSIMGLERMGSRSMAAGQGGQSHEIIGRIINAERRGGGMGAGGKLDLSTLSEAVQGFSNMQSTMFMRSGNMTNMDGALGMASKFGSLGGSYKDDQYKWSTIQAMDKGLASQGSSAAEGIKMGILRKAMPNASLSQLQEEQEKGLGSKHLMSGILSYVDETGGDENSKAQLLKGIVGGGMRMADINNMVKDENIGGFRKDFESKNPAWITKNLQGNAEGAVSSEVEGQIKEAQDTQDIKANNLGGLVDEMVGTTKDILTAVQIMASDSKEDKEAQAAITTGMWESIKAISGF